MEYQQKISRLFSALTSFRGQAQFTPLKQKEIYTISVNFSHLKKVVSLTTSLDFITTLALNNQYT